MSRPLYEKHDFVGVPGVLGGNCRICSGPIVEPWHQNVPVDSTARLRSVGPRLRAFAADCVKHGDMTPAGKRILEQIAAEYDDVEPETADCAPAGDCSCGCHSLPLGMFYAHIAPCCTS